MTKKNLTKINFSDIVEGDLLYSDWSIGYYSSIEEYNTYAERTRQQNFDEYKQRYRRNVRDPRAGQKLIPVKTPIFIIKKTRYYCESIQDEKVVYIPNEELQRTYLIKME
ncbi:MAG: hypothetical protein WC761_06780 [Candidatus Paceibacterota bacterium]|jgi:hypothetical protein